MKENRKQTGSGYDSNTLTLVCARNLGDVPDCVTLDELVDFFHYKMQPFHDSLEDVRRGLEYALSVDPSKDGGFVIIGSIDGELVGGLTMLETGMSGYVPEHLLLFVAVDPKLRSQGIGRRIIEFALSFCSGDVKLHVEKNNPARRLYERLSFTNKYLEMRFSSTAP